MNNILISMYAHITSRVHRFFAEDRGDTNFISILIILGVVILLATVFIGFKDKIVEQVERIISGFTIE